MLHGQTFDQKLRKPTEAMEITAGEVAEERVAARGAWRGLQTLVPREVLAMLAAMLLMVTFTSGLLRRVSHTRGPTPQWLDKNACA